MGAPYRVRPATRADSCPIAALERQLFSDPWSRSAIETMLRGIALVTEQQGTLVGYLFAQVTAGEAEILNLGVHPQHRRRGLARKLVERAFAKFAAAGARSVFLEVRESNSGARAAYRRLGFQEIGRRRGYYRRPVEDAVLMGRPLDV